MPMPAAEVDPELPDSGTPGSNLPAPYSNPWRSLGEDLRAVLADSGLRLRELRRRNAEGSLRRPGWWPAELAPLFWPLCAAVVVLALLAALLLWPGRPPARIPQDQPQAELPSPLPAVSPSASASGRPEAGDPAGPGAPATAPDRLPQAPATPATLQHSGSEALPLPDPTDGRQTATREAPRPVGRSLPDSAPQIPVDPLLSALRGSDDNHLLTDVESDPANGTLVLRLEAAFSELPASEQMRRAEQWRQQAVELGYDHLQLRDPDSGLRARDALVGTGMIVFSEPSDPGAHARR